MKGALHVVVMLFVLVLFIPVQVMQNSAPVSKPAAEFADSLVMPLPAIPLPAPGAWAPVSGVIRILVIATEFSDTNHTMSTDQIRQEYFGSQNESVAGYYREISYGAVTIQGDVVGWVHLDHPMIYYGRDCNAVDDSDCSGSPTSWWIARDTLPKVPQSVNFYNYDYFVFLHSGPGEESTAATNKDTVWSVTYLGGITVQAAGRTFDKFNIVPEVEANGAVPFGVYCHEFGHQLGLPDLYNTQTGKTIMGPWSLMDKGLWNGGPPGSSPTHMEAWSKIKLGWITGTLLAVANSANVSSFTVDPTEVTSTRVHVVQVTLQSPSQYYLVEVREHIGFDSALPDTGVLITYVNEKAFQGKVTVVDGHPNIPGLQDATWKVGQTFNDEQNNIAIAVTTQVGDAFQLTVNRVGPLPDLAVSKIYTQPGTIAPNDTVSILIDIVNQGTASTSNVPVQITLDGEPLANRQVSINAGDMQELSVSWTAVVGSHQLKVLIDPLDVLNELNRANNAATFTINVGTNTNNNNNNNGNNTNIGNSNTTVPFTVYTGNAAAWIRINGIQFQENQTAQIRPGNVTVEVQRYVNGTGVRQVFVSWSDGNSSNPRTITVTSQTNLTAIYKTQFYLQVNSMVGSPSGTGWYDAGSTATITVQPSIEYQNRTRQVFAGWSGDLASNQTSSSLIVNSPKAVTALWTVQYLVQVESPYGNSVGSGWQDAGKYTVVSVDSQIDYPNRTRRVFTDWTGDFSSRDASFNLKVDGPKILVAHWTTQYELTFRVSGIPNNTYVTLNFNNSQHALSVNNPYQGWFDQGAEIDPVANQTVLGFFQFAGWQNSTAHTVAAPFNVNGPQEYTAVYAPQFSLMAVPGFPVESILIGFAAGLFCTILLRRYRQGGT